MIKNIIIAILLIQLIPAYYMIYSNMRAMQGLKKAAEEVRNHINHINYEKLKKELSEELKKQVYNMSFMGIKMR